jgi:hypothetical protein
MRRGSDFAGAAKAFRAAQQWDPDDPAITGDLAVLLEYNDEAERYARNAKLDEAIAEYRKLTEQQVQKIGFKNNLAFALLYASKLDDAKKEAERLNPQPKAFIVAAEAITQGSKAGLAQAQKITSGEYESKTVTKAAGDIAMRYRAYPQAADLLEAGASGSNSGDVMGLASILRKTKKSEDMKFPDDPAGMVEKMFVEALNGRFTPEVSMRLSSKNALKFMKLQDPEEERNKNRAQPVSAARLAG